MTEAQLQALLTLAELTADQPEGITPSDFGAAMYPGTAGHINGARGLVPNGGRNLAAGSVLARLRKAGLVTCTDRGTYRLWRLTHAGRQALLPPST